MQSINFFRVDKLFEYQGVGKVLKLFPLNNKQGTVVAGLNVTSGCFYSGNEYVYAVKRNNTKGRRVHCYHFKIKR